MTTPFKIAEKPVKMTNEERREVLHHAHVRAQEQGLLS